MIGKTFGNYRIVDRLGQGGMGLVYKAVDQRLDRTVAIKMLPPHLASTDERQRFLQEARAASALEHPNICTIYDIGETPDGQMFIAMTYCDGDTLRQKIAHGPLDLDDAVRIAIDIARGLRRAHENDITHRDVKPANVMVMETGEVKIIDFGVAKLARGTGLTKTGSTVGTVAYMSPEQARGDRVDHQTDIWALGVILYEMVTGVRPFAGEFEQAVVYFIINENPTAPSKKRNGLPSELERIVMKALTKDRGERYATMAEMLHDLEAFQGGSTVSRSAVAAGGAAKPKRPRGAVAMVVVAGVAVTVAAGLILPRLRNTTAKPVEVTAPAPPPPAVEPARLQTPPETLPPVIEKTAIEEPPAVKTPPVAAPKDLEAQAREAAEAEREKEAAATRAATAKAAEETARVANDTRLIAREQLTDAKTRAAEAEAACPDDAAWLTEHERAKQAVKQAQSLETAGDDTAATAAWTTAARTYDAARTRQAADMAAITALVTGYETALEKRDIHLMGALFVKFPDALRSSWENFFSAARTLSVETTPRNMHLTRDGAAAEIGARLTYSGSVSGTAAHRWTMSFVRVGNAWRIADVTSMQE